MSVYIRRQPNPFEIAIVLGCLVFGFALLAFPAALHSTITKTVPGWEVTTFGALLLLSTLPILMGMWWHEPEGLTYEAFGCTACGIFMLAFDVPVIANSHLSSASIFFLVISVACLARTVQIVGELKQYRRSVGRAAVESEGD